MEKDKDNEEQKMVPRLQRDKSTKGSKPAESLPPSVTAGAIASVIDLAFNPSREKIREMTSIDRIQGRLLPQLDIIDMVWRYVIEVALFRQNAVEYKRLFEKDEPIPPALIGEFTYRTAQWQKSVQGTNLKSAVDLALAEVETRGEEGEGAGMDAWKD